MAGEHERQQLVAQLAVGERLAVLGAGAQEQREDVGPLVEVGRAAALGDHGVGGPVEQREAGAR